MQSRSTTIIGAGVAVAILGAVLVFMYARNLQGSAGAAPGSTVSAFVAVGPIPAGTKGSAIASLVKVTSVPRAARPADALTALATVSNLNAINSIEAGQVVTTAQFGAAGTPSSNTGGLNIPPGFNAVTINVPAPQNLVGYVSPGDLINIYMVSKDVPTGNTNGVRLVLPNVQVLSTTVANTPVTATAVATPSTGPFFWTVALTPQNVEKLLFAESFESVWFGLVHPGDGPASTGGQTVPSIFK